MANIQDGGSAFPLTFPSVDPKETDINTGMSKRELVAALILGACVVRGVEAEGAIEQADRYAVAYVTFYDRVYDRQPKKEKPQ